MDRPYSSDSLPQIECEPTFRKVTEDDYDAMIAISKGVYGGHDYLPFRYKLWCQDDQRELFGVFVDGKLVAFDSIFVIDGGETVLAKALRVDESFRGKGMTQFLAKVINQHIAQDLRGVKKLRIATASENVASIKIHEKLGFKHLLALAICALYGREAVEFTSRLRHLTSSLPGKVVNMSAHELIGYWEALSQSQRDRLAHHGTLVHDWDPFMIQLDNLQYLQTKLGWERGCQLLAVMDPTTNELRGFAVSGMNRNLAGFEYYTNVCTDDYETALLLMQAGWEEGQKDPTQPTAYVYFYNEELRSKIEPLWKAIETDNPHFIVDHAPYMVVMEQYIR